MSNCKRRANKRQRYLNETLKKFWEVSKVPEELDEDDPTETLSRYHHIQSRHKQIQCKTPMEGNQTKLPTNFTVAKKRLNNLDYLLYRKKIQNSSTNTINKYLTNTNINS